MYAPKLQQSVVLKHDRKECSGGTLNNSLSMIRIVKNDSEGIRNDKVIVKCDQNAASQLTTETAATESYHSITFLTRIRE